MCGIAGVVTWDERFRATRDDLAGMSARIAHRGPDGEAFHLTREGEAISVEAPQVGLAFRRLAILDPDDRAMQPMTSPDGRFTLVFNGEIYNFRELRGELTKLLPNHAWRTTGDSEVLLMSFATWGEHCVDRLNGMFAFAVWDERDKSLYLARDRMGQKPLYVEFFGPDESRPQAVAFASELPAIRALRWSDGSFYQAALVEYLQWGYVPTGMTIYGGATKLPAGTWWKISRDGVQHRRYFQHRHGAKVWPSDSQSLPREVRARVETAVARQMVSDVPVGCLLSGGIDSSIVALCMRKALTREGKLLTFSIGFDDPRYDETRHAQEVAAHVGSEHHPFTVRPHATSDLPKLVESFGEPFADSSALPAHYLSRETRAFVKVALGGDGGDELFGGYDRYRALCLSQRLSAAPPLVHKLLLAPLARLLPGVHPKSRGTRIKRLLDSLRLPPGARYASFMRLFSLEQIERLCGRPVRTDPSIIAGHWFAAHAEDRRDIVQAALSIDRETYLPDDLLTKVDRMSMRHGLEVRSPFMDHELVELATGLSATQLLRGGGKRMLREAFAGDLPASVFRRRKMGFAVPIGEWFRDELRAMLRDHLLAADSFAREHFDVRFVEQLIDEHERGVVDHSQRLYALLMLELWWKWTSATAVGA